MGSSQSSSEYTEVSQKSSFSLSSCLPCVKKVCKKCGCPMSYYSNRKFKAVDGTCREHTHSEYGICIDCGKSPITIGYGIKGYVGNCNHEWG